MFASLELIPLGVNKGALENEGFFSCSSGFKTKNVYNFILKECEFQICINQ